MVNSLYNLDYLLQSFNNDVDEVYDIIEIYLKIVPESLEKLVLANAQDDIEAEKKIAHKLKTTFSLFEIDEALEIARKIESGELSDEARKDNIDRLNEIVTETYSGLKNDIKTFQNGNNVT